MLGLLQEGCIVVYPWSILVGFEACIVGLLQEGSIVVYPWSILVGFEACIVGLLQEGSIVVHLDWLCGLYAGVVTGRKHCSLSMVHLGGL